MNQDLTKGPVTKSMLLFAVPMILGDLLQQRYNIADSPQKPADRNQRAFFIGTLHLSAPQNWGAFLA